MGALGYFFFQLFFLLTVQTYFPLIKIIAAYGDQNGKQ